jgi:putative DNA primase/helicase
MSHDSPFERSDDEEYVDGSEDAMAAEYAGLYQHLFRWTPGMGWMRCGQHAWRPDKELFAEDCARQIARLHANQQAKAAVARSIASSKTVRGIIALAKTDPSIAMPASEWDVHPFEFNTPGGIVDLRTGKTARRDVDSYFTQCARVAPASGAARPVWDAFLGAVFQGDVDLIEFMQRLVGYLLTAERREQKIFFMQGPGANGKSTLWDFIAWLLGNYMLKLPAHVLMHSQLQNHPTELAQLRGKRLAISSEIEEGQYWAESRIKELTGDETLTARFMRQDYFEFPMTHKHVIVGNYKPRLKGGDAALARRFVLIPFLTKFEGAGRDPHMIEKLRAEAPAVLAWAIQGSVKWYAEGLAIPSSVASASNEYMAENDDLQIWLEECCVLTPDAKTQATPLFGNYLAWLKARGQHPTSMKTWSDRMTAVPSVRKDKSNGLKVYRGIGLRAEDEST